MTHTPSDDPISSEIAKLQKPIMGRRLFSWIFFLTILLAFLITPIVASIWPAELEKIYSTGASGYFSKSKGDQPAELNKARSSLPTYMGADIVWDPNLISTSHQPWAADCKACHTQPFTRVQDKDCLVCHENIGDHVAKKINIDALHEVRCATCHREHMGEFGLAEQNKHYIGQECIECHANIKAVFPETKTENVKDFAKEHPQFRVQVNDDVSANKLIRVREGSGIKLIDKTSLKFPHDVHLDPAGVRGPKGKVKMECATCHKTNADGVGFKPVTMKEDCQQCHALRFETAVPDREVPHGSVEQVLSTLREFYSYVDVNDVLLDSKPKQESIFMLRPGKEEPVGTFINSPGGALSRAQLAAIELFEKTSCVVCHDVTRSSETGTKGSPDWDMPHWKIAPIPALHAWMPKANFDHSEHLSAQCTDCHAATTSKKASDVLMPAIGECRDCHAGSKPVIDKVTSDCGLCHGFHLPSDSAKPVLDKAHQSTISSGIKKR